MYNIKDYFETSDGIIYPNVRDIHFDKYSDMFGNLGVYRSETNYENNGVWENDLEDGVYIYQTNYDLKKALRIYKNYANYKFCKHTDNILISELQKRQRQIKLTEFPTGVVTVENFVIGQEIPYYHNYDTLLDAILYKKNIKPTKLYLKVLQILKELVQNEIIYNDVHARNFLVDAVHSTVKLIDFEDRLVLFDDKKKYMITNLKSMLYKLNSINNIEFKKDFEKAETLSQIEECVYEKHITI